MSLVSIFLITLGISLLGLTVGFLILWKERAMQRWMPFLLSFAAGSILGAALLDILPEALSAGADAPFLLSFVLLGLLTFFVVEKLLIWHHHAHTHDADDDEAHQHFTDQRAIQPLIIFGDALHNLLDGGVIAVAFLVDFRLGMITALAVLFHELPQEIGDFAILLHTGMSRRNVLLWNIIGAIAAPIGVLAGFLLLDSFENIEAPLLAFAAGNFMYIAVADLFPTIQHERRLMNSILQIAMLLVGIGIIWQLGAFLSHTA